MLEFVAVLAVIGLSNGVPLKSERINGGVDAPPAFAPHMAALVMAAQRDRVVCGGSIVTRRHILTAAHCLTPFVVDRHLRPNLYGRVGSNIWHSGGLVVYFKTHYIHPQWDEENIKYDVAVLLLTKRLNFSDKIAPIGLDFGWVGGGKRSYVTGWGTTWPKIDEISVNLAPTPDELQLLFVETLSPAQCQAGFFSSEDWVNMIPPLDPIVEICTFHSIRFGMCNGDSGSALVMPAEDRMTSTACQVGLVSWGVACARGAPDVFTRLYGVRDFLWPILNTCSSFNSSACFAK